jgi:uncharacterized protein (TIGR02996 family)
VQSETEFLQALAERPEDRALRLVFCDWLLEHGSPRGEAMALFEKGNLTSGERRRLEKLQDANARKWLGPLGDAVVLEGCQWAGGLLRAVRLGANLPAERYLALTGEIRLATVESLSIEPGRVAAQVSGFLAHPVLKRVARLEGDVGSLLGAQGFAFAPRALQITLWHPREELSALAGCGALLSATTLSVTTVEFLSPEFAEELADAATTSGALAGRREFELLARYATVEGAARWLRLASARIRGPARDQLQRWGVSYLETQLGLEGDELEQFTIDVSSPTHKSSEEAGAGELSVGARLATAASVLALLGGIGIRRVDVRQVPGGRVRRGELDALRAAARRLNGLEEFRVAGVLQSP